MEKNKPENFKKRHPLLYLIAVSLILGSLMIYDRFFGLNHSPNTQNSSSTPTISIVKGTQTNKVFDDSFNPGLIRIGSLQEQTENKSYGEKVKALVEGEKFQLVKALVKDVVDGDTVKVIIGKSKSGDDISMTVRMFHDTPESKAMNNVYGGRSEADCGGKEASANLKSILLNRVVYLLTDPNQGVDYQVKNPKSGQLKVIEKADSYGRALRYVFYLESENNDILADAGMRMLLQGYALLYPESRYKQINKENGGKIPFLYPKYKQVLNTAMQIDKGYLGVYCDWKKVDGTPTPSE